MGGVGAVVFCESEKHGYLPSQRVAYSSKGPFLGLTQGVYCLTLHLSQKHSGLIFYISVHTHIKVHTSYYFYAQQFC